MSCSEYFVAFNDGTIEAVPIPSLDDQIIMYTALSLESLVDNQILVKIGAGSTYKILHDIMFKPDVLPSRKFGCLIIASWLLLVNNLIILRSFIYD